MNIQTYAEHSICPDLLTGGTVIDAGCLGFAFSEAMRDLGEKVLAYDIQYLYSIPNGIKYYNKAIWNNDCILRYKELGDKQAAHISDNGEKIINSISLRDIYKKHKNVDVLKLDVEGSEYLILSDDEFQPIPRQISIEFHMHCHMDLHEKYYEKILKNLIKYYVPIQHELTIAHGSGLNYWNSLFIRKDLCN